MEFWIGLIAYSLVEYWLGKRAKPKANSAIEIAENIVKIIAKKKIGN